MRNQIHVCEGRLLAREIICVETTQKGLGHSVGPKCVRMLFRTVILAGVKMNVPCLGIQIHGAVAVAGVGLEGKTLVM